MMMETTAILNRIDQLEKLVVSQAKEIDKLKRIVFASPYATNNNYNNQHRGLQSPRGYSSSSNNHLHQHGHKASVGPHNNSTSDNNDDSSNITRSFNNNNNRRHQSPQPIYQPYTMSPIVHPVSAIPPVASVPILNRSTRAFTVEPNGIPFNAQSNYNHKLHNQRHYHQSRVTQPNRWSTVPGMIDHSNYCRDFGSISDLNQDCVDLDKPISYSSSSTTRKTPDRQGLVEQKNSPPPPPTQPTPSGSQSPDRPSPSPPPTVTPPMASANNRAEPTFTTNATTAATNITSSSSCTNSPQKTSTTSMTTTTSTTPPPPLADIKPKIEHLENFAPGTFKVKAQFLIDSKAKIEPKEEPMEEDEEEEEQPCVYITFNKTRVNPPVKTNFSQKNLSQATSGEFFRKSRLQVDDEIWVWGAKPKMPERLREILKNSPFG